MFLEMNKMNDEDIIRVYPVIDDEPEKIYEKLENRRFVFEALSENKLVPPGVGDMVLYEELDLLRQNVIALARKYGFGDINHNVGNSLKLKFDKELGSLIYEKMKITPSVAATLPMWQFLNLQLLPDVVFWRWGNSKEHFYSERRNYLGTQWWRYYLFSDSEESLKIYSKLNDAEIAELYERSGSRGLPEHIFEISKWFAQLSRNILIKNEREMFRSVIKRYNAELGFRNYFSLDENDKFSIFKNCFEDTAGLK